jgi:hypothetical protein
LSIHLPVTPLKTYLLPCKHIDQTAGKPRKKLKN